MPLRLNYSTGNWSNYATLNLLLEILSQKGAPLLNKSVSIKFMVYVVAGTNNLKGNLTWLLRRRGRSSK